MVRPRPSPASTPAQLAVVAALPEPALITRNRWSRGGVGILFANAAFCRLTGHSAAELAGKNTRLLHGTKTDLVLLQHGRHPGRPGPAGGGEGWLHRQDGTPFFARWNFAPLAAGRLVAIYHDLTESRHLHTALLQSQKLATVGLLAGGVAHDFNNLITVINGYCEILRGKAGAGPKVLRDVDAIHRAGLKASAVARQILEFSRRQRAEARVVNCNTLIREIAEILRRVAGEAVPLELRLASDLGNVRIDPTQFQQVLLNLCFNAREAMPGGGRLVIRTANHQVSSARDRRMPAMGRGLYAVVQVSDTGVGMAPGLLGCIFEPFFTTKPQGTGLGLATVRGIIDQHHGHILVRSTPGAGSVFEIFLPETPEAEQVFPVKLAGLPATVGTETLLLIEADVALRKMIAGILTSDGYRVTEVATAGEAAAAIAAGDLQPQLVLAPGDNPGVATLIRKLYAHNRALRLISVSTHAPAGAWPEIPARAVVYLPKPFALSTLVLKVRTLLDAGTA